MRSGKGKSYYGQYGCSDDLTPADTAEINRHRADIGLEPLEAERRDKNVIYITYLKDVKFQIISDLSKIKVCGNLFFLRVTAGLFFYGWNCSFKSCKKWCDNLR